MAISRMVGARIKRREDPRLITGAATYVDDIKLYDMQYMALLRSVHAHAKITRIDISKALGAPGVVAVLTGEEVRRASAPLPTAGGIEGLKVPDHDSMPVEKVWHLGQPVAAVIARDRYAARDALDLIEVDYEPLPAVVDVEKAMDPGSPLVHEQFGSNIAYTWLVEGGDVEQAFKDADVVVKQRMTNQRLIPNPMETRGVVAQYDRGPGTLTVWSSTQIPHILRSSLAALLSLAENKVRVVAPEVGGGFGCKLNIYAEEVIAAVAAMRVGKPVKWVEERAESFLATTHGRDQVAYVEAAAAKDGTILGLRMKLIGDLGAFHQLFTPAVPTFSGLMSTGVYKIANLRSEVLGVFTNKTPVDAYRGAGRPEATYYVERIVDMVAAELGLDPVDVRRRNFIPPDAFPYTTASGLTYDSGDYELCLKRALEMAEYQKFREAQAGARQSGRYIGIGVSTYTEICGIGPSAALPAAGWESGTVRVESSGKVTVLTGSSPHGQGQETSFAQMAADELGVPIDDIVVLHGDTSVVATGVGTFGSRNTAVGGAALMMCLVKVKDKATRLAAHLMEALPDDMVYSEGRLYVKGHADKAMTIAEVAAAAYRAVSLPPDMEPGMEATSFFEPSNFTFPFGAHIAQVEIDPDTGDITLQRYIAVDDCGKPINPLLIDGQIHGGIAQGIGQAMYEEAVYDESGQLLSGSLLDYALPTAAMLPRYETDRTETPTPVNPMGAKGVGEAGTIGASAAVVNATVDALGHLGVRHADMPLKAEKIWRLLQEARGEVKA
jgi:carbon-monoxide dehydrogenase large subunit